VSCRLANYCVEPAEEIPGKVYAVGMLKGFVPALASLGVQWMFSSSPMVSAWSLSVGTCGFPSFLGPYLNGICQPGPVLVRTRRGGPEVGDSALANARLRGVERLPRGLVPRLRLGRHSLEVDPSFRN
jgi:hypothetical protein